jgi:hypothetical protein
MLVAAGHLATAGVSVPVAALTEGVLQTMFLTRLTTVCGIVVAVSLLGATTALLAYRAIADGHGHAVARAESPRSVDEPKQAGQKQEVDQAEAEAQSIDNLKTLAIAMHNYHDDQGQFPPAAVYSKDGKPLLSWRVLLLPYLDQDQLFKQFKLYEPWDGSTNKKLLASIPKVYASPIGKAKGTQATVYQVFTGAGTIFPSPNASRLADLTDGTNKAVLIIEAADAVPWTKPADLPYDSKKPLPKLGGISKRGIQAVYADGSFHLLQQPIDEATLRALITINGARDR